MKSIINKHMSIGELRGILKLHGIDTAYGWEIMLYLVFNTYKTDELTIEGFGRNAEIHPSNHTRLTE